MKTFTKNGRTYAKWSDLTPWDLNPRDIEGDNLEQLMSDIKKAKDFTPDGQIKPILVTSTGLVIGGNQRMKAFKNLGITDIWVSVLDTENPKQAFEWAMKDNMLYGYIEEDKLKEVAIKLEIDDSVLGELMIPTGEVSIADVLLDIPETEDETDDEEDEAPEVDEVAEPQSKPGAIYQLGVHRLMVGDSTKGEDVKTLLGGVKADMVFTDPPYALFGNSTGVAGVADDKMTRPFFLALFKNMRDNTKLFAHIYTCCDWHSAFSLQAMAAESGLTEKNLIVWDKGDGGVGAMYQQCYEFVWFHANSPLKTKTSGSNLRGERVVNGKPNIWRHSRVSKGRVHNAQKPVEMIANAIKNSSDKGGIVLDIFGGSGSTLIAADQVGRACYMMEIDPKYADVIRKRYAQHIEAEDWQAATPEVTA